MQMSGFGRADLAGIVNQSWLKLTASFNDLVGAGKEVPPTE
jgi:hypothetical protein